MVLFCMFVLYECFLLQPALYTQHETNLIDKNSSHSSTFTAAWYSLVWIFYHVFINLGCFQFWAILNQAFPSLLWVDFSRTYVQEWNGWVVCYMHPQLRETLPNCSAKWFCQFMLSGDWVLLAGAGLTLLIGRSLKNPWSFITSFLKQLGKLIYHWVCS